MESTIKNHIVLTLIVSAAAGHAFGGQPDSEISLPETPSSEWEFHLEPYLWTPGLDGSVGVGRLTTDIDSSSIDVLENLKMAAALQFEARYQRWGFIMDGFYADLGADGTTPGPIYDSVGVDLKQFIGELSVAYRIYECPKGFVDLYAGIRYNNLSLDLDATVNVPGIQMVGENASESIVNNITRIAESAIEPRVDEFKNASTARREEIVAEVRTTVKAEAEEQVKKTLVKRLKRIRRNGGFDLRDIEISRIARSIKAERLALVRSNAELAAARIRAAADATNSNLEGKVAKAESRVQQAQNDLSDAISTGIQNNLPRTSSGDQEWIDPIVGVRAQWNFNDKWYLAGKSDIGGFSVGADLAWSIQGTVGYRFTETMSAELGYRYLDTDYSDGDFSYDIAEHGLFLGVNFAF